MFSVNQVRHAIVANTISTKATLALFKGDATANQIYICDADGLQYTTVRKRIAFKQYNDNGLITSSEVIDVDKIDYVKVLGYEPQTFKTATITPGTIVANSYYELKILFNNWGSLSSENQYTRNVGYTTAASGDDAENIVDGLVELMSKTLSNEQPSTGAKFSYTKKGATTVYYPENPYFTISKVGSTTSAKLMLTTKAQSYATGLKQNRSLEWTASINSTTADGTVIYTPGKRGVGIGKDIKDLEWFSKGYRADQYRGMGYPSSFEESYVSDTTAGYNIIEIGHYFQGDNQNIQKSHKTLTIAVKTTALNFSANLVSIFAAMTGINIFAPVSSTGTLLGSSVALDSTVTSKTVTFPAGFTYTNPVKPTWITTATFASAVLTITPEVNSTGSTRSAYLTITSGTNSYLLLVTQPSS